MSKPSTSDFLAAALGTYSGDPAGSSGLTVLTNAAGTAVTATKPGDGFHGVAFETASGQVIVAFEGTALGSLQTRPTFVGAQIQADQQIAEGQNPRLYTDALQFTGRALAVAAAQGITSDDVFVDGHSLGGAQAEYVAVKTGLGGDTFGAPGIPSVDINTGLTSRLRNFVDYGDPVGNYSDNPDVVGHLLMGPGIERYGRATYVGQRTDVANLIEAGQLYGTSPIGTAAAAGIVIDATIDHHLIEDYAADLGVSLPGSGAAGSGSHLTAADLTGVLSTILGEGGAAGLGLGSFSTPVQDGLTGASGASLLDTVLGHAPHHPGHVG